MVSAESRRPRFAHRRFECNCVRAIIGRVINTSFLRQTREKEAEVLRTADDIYLIGWSMPETDLDQISLIDVCMGDRDKPLDKVTVINCGATPEYFGRVARVFRVDPGVIEIYNNGFLDFVTANGTGARKETA